MASSVINISAGARDIEPVTLAGGLLAPGTLQELDKIVDGDSALDIVVLPTRVLGALLRHVELLGERLDNTVGRWCAGCGCSATDACETDGGACSWVADDLCSACRYAVQPCDDGMEGFVVTDLAEGVNVTGPIEGDDDDPEDHDQDIVWIHRVDAERRAAQLNGRTEDTGEQLESIR